VTVTIVSYKVRIEWYKVRIVYKVRIDWQSHKCEL